MRINRSSLRVRLATAGALAMALAACDERRGAVDAPEPASLAELSDISDLPYAPPAEVSYQAPAQGYAWAERAYGLQEAVYDAAPDYGFYYDEVEPLVWETEDDWALYAEPWDDGYRYYYYEPGADYPYFVRDGAYGYGYGAGGVLVAVFDLAGRYLPAETVRRCAPLAGRYYVRGHDLRMAAAKSPRIRLTEQAWSQRAPQLITTAEPWLRAGREAPGWRAWREREGGRELQRFAAETQRRIGHERQGHGPGRSRDMQSGAYADRRLMEQPHRRQLAQDERRPTAELRRQEIWRRPDPQAEQQRRREMAGVPHQQPERQHQQLDQQRRGGEAQRQPAERQQRQQVDQQRRWRQAERPHGPPPREAQQPRPQPQAAPQQGPRQERAAHEQPAHARSAQQQGQPATAHERGDAAHGNGRGHDRKG